MVNKSLAEKKEAAQQSVSLLKHPLVISAGIFVGITAVCVASGLFIVNHMRQQPPQLPVYLTKAVCPAKIAASSSKPLKKPEVMSAETLARAWQVPEANRLSHLNHLEKHFRKTPSYSVAVPELQKLRKQRSELLARQKKARDEANRKKQQEREEVALSAYARVLASNSTKDRKKFITELNKVVKQYPKTQGAKKAAERAAKEQKILNDAIAAAKRRKEEAEAERKKQAAFQRELELKIPRKRFLERYNKALRAWKLSSAKIHASKLALNKEYPGLRSFAKSCIADVEALMLLDQRLNTSLNKAKGREVEIIMAKGHRLKGKITSPGKNYFKLKKNHYSQKIDVPADLNIVTLMEMYEQNRVAGDPPVPLMRALYVYSIGNLKNARKFFQQSRKVNPRYHHHMQLIRYVEEWK